MCIVGLLVGRRDATFCSAGWREAQQRDAEAKELGSWTMAGGLECWRWDGAALMELGSPNPQGHAGIDLSMVGRSPSLAWEQQGKCPGVGSGQHPPGSTKALGWHGWKES